MGRSRVVILLLLAGAAGCGGRPRPAETLTLATTTSTRDSGLLDVIVPAFERETGISVKVVAVGSGQALQLGRRGDADVILAHSPEAEEAFLGEGHGEGRRTVMTNDFVLVGPKGDPAALRREPSVVEAFRRLAAAKAGFVSRGDDSGTHRKERQIWGRAGIVPKGDWYVEAGAGMAEVLRMADQKGMYTLSDRGTFLAGRRGLGLSVASEGDPLLLNTYSVIVVSPARHPGVHHRAAVRFAEFLGSTAARDAIARFGVADYGEPLFRLPDAGTGDGGTK